jgi:hypothetical protein
MNTNRIPETDEFYIGYLTEGPRVTMTFLKRFVTLFAITVPLLCAAVVLSQKTFSTSNFDYNTPVTMEGRLYERPYPLLKVEFGRTIHGESISQTILLVGSGKYGVTSLLKLFSGLHTEWKDGDKVSITGNLIYGDGKSLLQINSLDDIAKIPTDSTSFLPKNTATRREAEVIGEVVDPKCFFGVMKPGEGKPHRSCAIRCIHGGIPPVFHTGPSEYYLLVGENMEPLKELVLGIVGDRVALRGEIIEVDDWNILKVKEATLTSLIEAPKSPDKLLSLDADMTLCTPSAKK